jgi:hypothetical protein
MNGGSAMNNEVVDPHLTTKIVRSYVRHHTVGTGQISDLPDPSQTDIARWPVVIAFETPPKFGGVFFGA